MNPHSSTKGMLFQVPWKLELSIPPYHTIPEQSAYVKGVLGI